MTAGAIERERSLIRADMGRFGKGDGLFDEWVQEHKIDLTGRDEWIAESVFYSELTRAREKENSVTSFPLAGVTGLAISGFPNIGPPIDREWEIAKQERRQREINQYESAANELDRRVGLGESELDLLGDRLRHFRYPRHLVPGLVVLSLFAITGILFPLALMPQETSKFTEGHKLLAIGGLVLGLLLVVGYIAFILREVVRDHGQKVQAVKR